MNQMAGKPVETVWWRRKLQILKVTGLFKHENAAIDGLTALLDTRERNMPTCLYGQFI